MNACHNCEADGESCFDPSKNPALKREIIEARKNEVSEKSKNVEISIFLIPKHQILFKFAHFHTFFHFLQ
mgnify:CR=1 FL=1